LAECPLAGLFEFLSLFGGGGMILIYVFIFICTSFSGIQLGLERRP
jgi:hypothetical protein